MKTVGNEGRMEFVGEESRCRLEIVLTSDTREKLKKILQTPCQALMFVSVTVEGDTESDFGEGARNIYYKAEGVEPHRGKYVCTKEEYEDLCKAREISDDAERTLIGKTVVIIVKDGDIVSIC